LEMVVKSCNLLSSNIQPFSTTEQLFKLRRNSDLPKNHKTRHKTLPAKDDQQSSSSKIGKGWLVSGTFLTLWWRTNFPFYCGRILQQNSRFVQERLDFKKLRCTFSLQPYKEKVS
jgi:hypothetical protein